jgi:hypothetical protein
MCQRTVHGMKPRAVATLALAVRCSTTRLYVIHYCLYVMHCQLSHPLIKIAKRLFEGRREMVKLVCGCGVVELGAA